MRTIITPHARWIDTVDASAETIMQIAETYDFHELDLEAIMEEHQSARVDRSDDYIFAVIHFPKLDPITGHYIVNEFEVYLKRDTLITFRYLPSRTVDSVLDYYELNKYEKEQSHSGYILYKLLDTMMDTTFKVVESMGKEIRMLEKEIFARSSEKTIENMLVRRRNIIALKHMVRPQIRVMKVLEYEVKIFFGEEVEAYFEHLQDKIEQLVNEIETLEENIASMESSLRALYDVRSAATIKIFTIFSAFMLPLTLVTGFFGMNIDDLPFDHIVVYEAIALTALLVSCILFIMWKCRKI